MCHANWGTNQVKPSIKEDLTERVARAIYQAAVGPAQWDAWDTFAPDAWGRVRSMAQARAAIKVMRKTKAQTKPHKKVAAG